jgi:hypothetical protein
VADRFDGLAQGMKRAQAESGTAAEVPHEKRDNFRGVLGTLHREMTGRPQRKANLCRVRVRRMRSSRRGSGNACRLGDHRMDVFATVDSGDDVCGGRLRARNTGYGVSPSFLLQALYAREPRAAAKGSSP